MDLQRIAALREKAKGHRVPAENLQQIEQIISNARKPTTICVVHASLGSEHIDALATLIRRGIDSNVVINVNPHDLMETTNARQSRLAGLHKLLPVPAKPSEKPKDAGSNSA